MNINVNASRLLSTVAIWIAAAVIFAFGFFGGKIHVDGMAIYFWGAIGLARQSVRRLPPRRFGSQKLHRTIQAITATHSIQGVSRAENPHAFLA